LVEGKSELAFINKLKESQFAEFLYVLADEYEGKGNRHKKKIELLLKQYATQGYRVFIQGDADGAAQSPFRSLIQSGLVDEADTFYFPHDFESSVPSALLFVALNTLGRLTDVDIGDFETAVEGNTSSVATVLADKFQCDIKPIKVALAKAVAEMINGLPNTYLSHEWLMESELGSFIKFLRRIP
jgi:hypothetical protein